MIRLGLSVLLALAVTGCSKCGPKAQATSTAVERVLPRGAVAVVVVPNLAAAGQKLTLVEALKVSRFAAQLQGFADGKALVDALVAQVGIDVRSAQALEAAGVDGTKAAGLAALVTGQLVLALPLADEKKFAGLIEQLAYRRLSAGALAHVSVGASTVNTFALHQGEAPKLGYVVTQGYALVGDGRTVPTLGQLATMGPSDALSSDPTYKAQLDALPAERDVVVYLPLGSPLLVKAPFTSAVGALTLTSAGLVAQVLGTWKGDSAQLAALEPTQGARSLTGFLPADAFLVAQFLGDPAKLGPWARTALGPHVAGAFEAQGFEVKTEVLEQLRPGLVAALSLSERPPMDRGMPSLDIRQVNPFVYAHLSGVAAVKSKDLVVPVLQKVAAIAPQFGATMELHERPDGQKAMLTRWAQGEGVHFAPKADLVFFGSPVQRLDALVKRDGQGVAPVSALGDEAFNVAIDLSKLASSVRALPESAWGIGGFAIKATTVRWLDATDDLKAVSLSVGAHEGAVHARLQLTLGQATK
jgi:hypothetical protein